MDLPRRLRLAIPEIVGEVKKRLYEKKDHRSCMLEEARRSIKEESHVGVREKKVSQGQDLQRASQQMVGYVEWNFIFLDIYFHVEPSRHL